MGKDGMPSKNEGHSTEPKQPESKSAGEEKSGLGAKIKSALHKS